MKVEKIDHIVFLVPDLEKAAQQFSELFELNFVKAGEIKEMDVRSMIEPKGIELVEPVQPDGLAAGVLKKRGPGFTLLSLKVPNLDQAIQEMTSKGIRLIWTSGRGKLKAAVFHPKDFYNIMIELVEYETEHGALTASRMPFE